MTVCDFRVQCGRCESDDEKDACTILMWVVAGCYSLAFVYLFSSSRTTAPLVRRVMNIWCGAYAIRAVSAVSLALHLDIFLPPVVLEALFNLVWLLGCFSINYYVAAVMIAGRQISRMRRNIYLSQEKVQFITNGVWFAAILFMTIFDGLRKGWPHPGPLWIVWMSCSLYLGVTNFYYTQRFLTAVMSSDSFKRSSMSHIKATARADKTPNIKTIKNEEGNKSWFTSKYDLKRQQDTKRATTLVKLFMYPVVTGMALYSIFLLFLGVLWLGYPHERTIRIEMIVSVMIQAGMLLMGFGMQFAVTRIPATRSASTSLDSADVKLGKLSRNESQDSRTGPDSSHLQDRSSADIVSISCRNPLNDSSTSTRPLNPLGTKEAYRVGIKTAISE